MRIRGLMAATRVAVWATYTIMDSSTKLARSAGTRILWDTCVLLVT